MVAIPNTRDHEALHQPAAKARRLSPRPIPNEAGADARARRAPAVQLTPRDAAILRDLTRFYGLTVEQIARRHFHAEWTAYHRLKALAGTDLVRFHRPWYRGPGVYVVTPAGARAAAVGLLAPKYRPMALAHHLAVADVSELLLRKFAQVDGIAWVCERELRRASMLTVRDRGGGRLMAGVPHVPDGALATTTSRWAIEVELTRKADAEYGRILRWYAAQRGYRRVAWYARDRAVAHRLGTLITRERLEDLVTVQPLPDEITVYRWD